MDYMVQVDVVKCFDSIDHRLLLEHLSKLLGTDNAPLIGCIFKSPNSLLLHYVYWNGPLILQQILLVWKDIIHKTDC